MIKLKKEFKYGYLAGIIEGEGCFNVRYDGQHADVSVEVSSNDLQLPRWLQDNFGGKVYKSAQYFGWKVYRADILPHLQKIQDKLLFKKQQCKSFIQLCEMMNPKHVGKPYDEEKAKERGDLISLHKYIIQMDKKINRAGKHNEEVIVSLSGGMDSTTMLYYLIWKGLKPQCVSFDYGSKHNTQEIRRAKEICKNLKLKHDVVKMHFVNDMFESALLKRGKKVPHGHYEHVSMKQTVVPNRNAIMLSILIGVAESRKIKNVAFGAHVNDYTIYPDCRPEFAAAINNASILGTYQKVNVFVPFINYTKSDIVYVGNLLKVPFEKTWSCYEGKEKSCGKCGTCRERIESFQKTGIQDPIEYNEVKK